MHRVEVTRTAGTAVVEAGGELDAFAAPELSAAFAGVIRETSVLADLDAVSFLDSTALGVVVRAMREIADEGGDARIVLPRSSARRIFEITTLDRVLPVATSRAAALAELSG
jgi:anti-sigma B factor antagonist